MSPSHVLLWAPLLLAGIVTLRAIVRERDARLAALLLAVGLLGARSLFAPPLEIADWSELLGANAAPWLVDLAIHLAALLTAVVASRLLRERNQAERVQWTSMEALRTISEHLREARGPLDEELPRLLALGCERFGLETGLLVERDALGQLSVLGAHAPGDVALAAGPAPDLESTFAGRALASDRIVVVQRAAEGHWSTHPEHAPFGWESFLGIRLPNAAASGGSPRTLALCFADRSERKARLSGVEQSLITLLAESLALRAPAPAADEAEKPLVEAAAAIAPAKEPLPQVGAAVDAGPGSGDDDETRQPAAVAVAAQESAPTLSADAIEEPEDSLDPNAALRSLRPALRRAAGRDHELALDLAPSVPRVRMTRVRFDRFVESLVLHAAEAAPEGARITVRTADVSAPHESLEESTGAAGFATVAVCACDAVLGTDALAALYEGRGDWGRSAGHRKLPLARLVRVLRDHGGDLSLESEEGVGTTLTTYLAAAPARPSAHTPATARGAEPVAAAIEPQLATSAAAVVVPAATEGPRDPARA